MTEGTVAATRCNICTVVISDEELRKTASDYSAVVPRETITDALDCFTQAPPDSRFA